MQPPFDVRQFFEVFERYNTAVWPAQIALTVAALVAVALAVRPRSGSDRLISVILGGMWLWMGVVYHLVFFRPINPAAGAFGALFALEGVLLILLGGWLGRLRFAWTPTIPGAVGAALVGYALVVYPILGYALGHRYPATPTFGLPCPTAILTLGLLAWVAPPWHWGILLIPLAWSGVGALAAMQLGVWEDLGLVVAGALTLALSLSVVPRAIRSPSSAIRRSNGLQ